MIDYYLHKHCLLSSKIKSKIRCNGCIWLDKNIHKCIFSIGYPKSISISEFKRRILLVNKEQQKKLDNPNKRFVL